MKKGLSAVEDMLWEPRHEKTCLWGFRPGLTQTKLYSHRRWLDAYNFRFILKRDCTINVAKRKVLISCGVTAQLICAFVYANTKSMFSHDKTHGVSVDNFRLILSFHQISIHCENLLDLPG